MSQFAPKNPAAWARPPGTSQQLNAGLFQSPLIGGQPFGATVPQMGMSGMINAAAFSQQAAASMGVNLGMLQGHQTIRMQAQQQQPPQKNRVFSGVVTKMHDSYGFIDDDVFFQVSVVRGTLPRTGDRVMVEATYNSSMPFKWTALRVELLRVENIGQKGAPHSHISSQDRARQNLSPRGSSGNQNWSDKGPLPLPLMPEQHSRDIRSGMRPRSPPSAAIHRCRTPPRTISSVNSGNGRRPLSPVRRSPQHSYPKRSARSPLRGEFSRNAGLRALSPKRGTSVHKHDSLKRSPNSTVRKSPSLKRDIPPHESLSPPRRRSRIIPRYQCYMPKVPITMMNEIRSFTIIHLRKRYPSMYIPSDFVEATVDWPFTTPMENPISICTSPISFHVLHKDIDNPHSNGESKTLNPLDADPRYSAKVILMGHAGLNAVHQKAYGLLPDGSLDESIDPVSIFRCISFLVGTRGKGELMALGGSWSPSLDGQNPSKDPQVLIHTAVRTVRALTGIDLSNCTKWFKLAQIRYYRAEKNRVDTTVLLLPDTNGLMPGEEDYRQVLAVLKNQLSTKLAAVEAQSLESLFPDGQNIGEGGTSTEASKEQMEEAIEEDDEDDLTPTHWAMLDVKAMKVAELRQELMARDLETKGVKSILCARLQQAIDQEKAKEEGMQEKVEESVPKEGKKEDKVLTEEEKKALEKLEKEKKEKKASLERHYSLPKEAGILVYPNRLAKGGKFDCKVVTLANLLDYRIDDCKEHSFELAILVESIAEIINRSQAFTVYKAVSSYLDKDAEKKRRDDAKIAELVEKEVKQEKEVDSGMKIEKNEEEQKKEKERQEEERRNAIAEPRKPIVVNRSVFQAFAHFDQNLCGYITDKDAEDILYTLGLNISRAQIQKLVKKFSFRDKINYRHFTDSWVNKDGTVTYVPGTLPDAPNSSTLVKGNVLSHEIGETVKPRDVPLEANNNDNVIYHGAMINIPSMLEKISQMEAERNAALQKTDILEAQLKEGARNAQLLEKKKKRLEDDVDKYRKRLHDAEKCLKNSVDDTVQMKSAIQEFRKIGEKIQAMADKMMPTTKDEEKSVEKDEKDIKKERKDDKTERKIMKKKENDDPAKRSVGSAIGKKELTLVDEVIGESMDVDVILKEEINGDEKDNKEQKEAENIDNEECKKAEIEIIHTSDPTVNSE